MGAARPIRSAVAVLLVLVQLLSTAPAAMGQAEGTLRQALDAVIKLLEQNYKDPVTADKLLQGAIKGALQELNDPYTQYFSPEEYQAFMKSLDQNTITGIGVRIELMEQYITVQTVFPGTPADLAGLLPGDRILEADGVSLIGASAEKAAAHIRGPKGQAVRLKVERPMEDRTFTLEIVRDVIQIPVLDFRLLPSGYGYIKLYDFSNGSATKFWQAVGELQVQGARGMILDLLDNPGGYLDEALDIAGAFVPRGKPVARAIGRGDSVELLRSGQEPRLGVEWVVLVNAMSASAAEIVAGAIKDYGSATLVGTRTFGKGSVQRLQDLGVLGGIKFTIAEYRSPNGTQVQGVGVTPDVLLDHPGNDPERRKPLEVKRTLYPGFVGLDVLAAQGRLRELGFLGTEPNGWYGPPTLAAVRGFQRKYGLEATGVVDEALIAKLNTVWRQYLLDSRRNLLNVYLAKAEEILGARLKQAAGS